MLSKNRIVEIKGLDGLTGLYNLYLDHTSIKEVKNVNCLVNLGNLFLGHNQIETVRKNAFQGMHDFKFLDMSFNTINESTGNIGGIYKGYEDSIHDCYGF